MAAYPTTIPPEQEANARLVRAQHREVVVGEIVPDGGPGDARGRRNVA